MRIFAIILLKLLTNCCHDSLKIIGILKIQFPIKGEHEKMTKHDGELIKKNPTIEIYLMNYTIIWSLIFFLKNLYL